jgi:hypothetical protein
LCFLSRPIFVRTWFSELLFIHFVRFDDLRNRFVGLRCRFEIQGVVFEFSDMFFVLVSDMFSHVFRICCRMCLRLFSYVLTHYTSCSCVCTQSRPDPHNIYTYRMYLYMYRALISNSSQSMANYRETCTLHFYFVGYMLGMLLIFEVV